MVSRSRLKSFLTGLALYTMAAAMVGYFDQLSAAINDGDADSERLDEIARRHGMEVIGPVPEGYL